MIKEYAAIVGSMVAEAEAYNPRMGINNWVLLKKGIVVRKTRFAPASFTGTAVFRGKFYPLYAPAILPTRTLMSKTPIKIGGDPFYLELKGYGRWGRELYFQEHSSGDVFYGTYLENALREFERLDLALALGLSVPLPLAVVEIPREEYIRRGFETFEQRLSMEIGMFRGSEVQKLINLVGEISDTETPEMVARRIIRYIRRHHAADLVEGVRHVICELSGGPSDWTFGMHTIANALLSGKPVGYLVRASKCPVRVGDPADKSIETPRTQAIAREMGHIFIILLEAGILCHCPGTGNWTMAGEMADLADTFDLTTEETDLRRHIEKMKKEERIERADIASFVRYLIGPEHTGVLCPYFIEGMFGEKLSLERATANLLKLL